MDNKTLVAYFSASGVTDRLAKTLAKALKADLHQIIPEKPYTAADLDWMDKNSRSTLEMADKSSRPKIANKVENMDGYDVIFVGFPIWWYVAPTIINTFLESYDLSGKTIVPFATSGGSGMGRTNDFLKPSVKDSRLLAGKVFSCKTAEETLETWAKSLEL
ncbi:MAG: NAD(P)H-dependent oxidoreductase [Clostridia bacterium]|nr:NAD(P)H-dependent oxidoreductase [Clostridia bacterium]MDE7329388.1 NAD(P)H-dependent oxidoreductase [Clostridia bacterium]